MANNSMLQIFKQARSAVSLLNPQEVRNRARRKVRIGLVAASDAAYDRMEDLFGFPATPPGLVYRVGDPDAPAHVDLVVYEPGLAIPQGAYPLNWDDPEPVLGHIARHHEDLALALARQFPAFRRPVIDRTIQMIARENAIFALTTALPDVIPNLVELPWAFGEWASDTAFLTANQVRMAFLIAAAAGKEVGFSQQKLEILGIGAGAFGWRAIARELVGKIPFGGGLIPKAAIAYAGTFVVGKSLERLHAGRPALTRDESEAAYRQGLDQGKTVAEALALRRQV